MEEVHHYSMTREMYETLPLNELRQVARARGLKGISSLRKADLIEVILGEDKKIQSENINADEKKTDENEVIEKQKNKSQTTRRDHGGESQNHKRVRRQYNDSDLKSLEKEPVKQQNIKEKSDNEIKNTDTEACDTVNSKKETKIESKQDVQIENPHRLDINSLDSGQEAKGILEVMSDGYGFIRSDNFMPGENDVYVSPSQIRKFGLKTGDFLYGNTRIRSQNEKFSALLFVKTINGLHPSESMKRLNFENMTPIFPNERIYLERPGGSLAMRIVDLISPIGKGQRGMIVSPPKAGKTTLLKDAAKSILKNNPEMHLIILLIDERPEEVTDMKETVKGPNVEVIYSTFDEMPDHHKRVSEMVIERAKRLVENKRDVVIFIDSITRLARAYNQVVPPSGRTLSGGLDPAALHMPKRFFGAARNMREGGSLTILATALVDTGSKMDDVVYEEFKGTGNMELVLDRKLQERRVFPAIDIVKSGTRREDLLLSKEEQEAVNKMRRALNGLKSDEAAENILNMFSRTRNNEELIRTVQKQKML